MSTPAGDVDYARFGIGYADHRRADPPYRRLHPDALGELNMGAGAGSYEPDGRQVVVVEPSESMIAQRP